MTVLSLSSSPFSRSSSDAPLAHLPAATVHVDDEVPKGASEEDWEKREEDKGKIVILCYFSLINWVNIIF